MRQHGETKLFTLPNNLMPGILTKRDWKFSARRKTAIDQVHDGIVLFAENMPRENFNNNKLSDVSHNFFPINSMDQIRQDTPNETVDFLE